MSRLSVTAALAVACACGCSGELGEENASDLIAEHYRMHASDSLGAALDVQVVAILAPDDNRRQARHMIMFKDSSGQMRADSGSIATASLTRSDRGWAVDGYDPRMAELVAIFTQDRVYSHYEDLLDVADTLGSLITEAHPGRYSFRGDWQGYSVSNVTVTDGVVPAGYEWGITEFRPSQRELQVLWVRSTQDTTHVCAETLSALGADRPPPEFYYVGGTLDTACTGRTSPVQIWHVDDSTKVRIVQAGGVLLQPAYRRR